MLRSRVSAAAGAVLVLVLARPTCVRAGDPPPAPAPAPLPDAEGVAALARAKSLDGQVEDLYGKGRYAEALPLARESLAIREKRQGPDHPSTSASLGNLALVLEELGEYEEAKALLLRALSICERVLGPDHPSTGTSASNLASLLQEMGDYAGAKPLFERALKSAENAKSPDPSRVGLLLNNLAMLLRDMGNYAGAKPLLVRALALSETTDGPDHPSTATQLNNLAMLLKAMGDLAGAKPLYERALAISEKALGADHPTTGGRLNNLAMLLQSMGAYPAARPLFARALAISEKALGPDHPSTGRQLKNLAVLLQDLGDFAEAKPLMVRALAISEATQGPDHPATGGALDSLAGLLQDMGDYAGAKPLLERALDIYGKALGPDHPLTGSCVNNLALLLGTMGDHAAAKPLFERALALSERTLGPDHPSTGARVGNLAALLEAMGDYGDAKRLGERALAISEKAYGPDHPSTGGTLNNLAAVLWDQRDLAGAKRLYERALAIAEKAEGPDHPSTGRQLKNLANLLQDMGDYPGALRLLARALQLTEGFLRRASVGAQGAERLALTKPFRDHLDSYLAASRHVGSTGYPEVLRFKGLVGRLDALDRTLARQADPALHAQVEALAALDRRLAALANSVPSDRDADGKKSWQEQYAGLAEVRQATTRELAVAFAPFREALEGREAGLAEVQQSLAAHEALVDVLLSRGHYLAFVVGQAGAVERLDLGEATQLEPAAAAFVRASQRAGVVLPGARRGVVLDAEPTGGDTATWAAAGRALRERVLAPIEARLPPETTTLYLVPDGALAAVPFATLPGRKEGQLLIDDYHLTHLPTAQALVGTPGASAPEEGALLIGGVDYDQAKPLETAATPPAHAPPSPRAIADLRRAPPGERFGALAATGQEVEGLAQKLGTAVTVLRASEATEGRLRSLAARKRVLHFATHGFVRTDLMTGLRPSGQPEKRWMAGGLERHLAAGIDPMLLAGLAMAGANPREGADGDDGILTAAEASYMDLRGCDLVVLSACETAMGTPESGEGVLGLVHGFQLAGAQHVVGSLWKVDDTATRLLMDRFYEGVLDKEQPLPPADALREAALWLRDSKPGGRDYSAPRYWAAFVAYGK